MFASASSTFMWPGIRPATGWMANLTVIPRLVSWSYNSRTLCWACATAMPYPGMTTTSRACSSSWSAPSTVSCFQAFCSPSAFACCTVPNAPNRTLVNDRFIARHMMIERMRPLEPSSAPAVTSSLLLSTNPIATADRPAYEFKIEITVGISAPPIGMMNSTPNSTASPTTPENAWDDHGHAQRRGDHEDADIDDVLSGVRHGPLGNPLDLPQLARGHQAPRKGQEPQNDFGDDRERHPAVVDDFRLDPRRHDRHQHARHPRRHPAAGGLRVVHPVQ